MSVQKFKLTILFVMLVTIMLQAQAGATDYYIDSVGGDDNADGLTPSTAWKSHTKVHDVVLGPGDSVNFKRGSQFSGPIVINESGTSTHPILLTDYGEGNAPRFTNPDDLDMNGNCIRISGDYIIVENLYFHDTPPTEDATRLSSIFQMGAIFNMPGADHNIIRDNEFWKCTKAIQSTGEYTLITNNHMDGPSHALWYEGGAGGWGPMGIQLGIGNQELSYNTILNYLTEDSPYGTDGGAIEFDDGRFHKDNLYVHHNFSEGNAGFFESSWGADYNPYVQEVHNLRVAFNVSNDGQSYAYMFAPTHDSYFENNTINRANDYPDPYRDFDEIFYCAFQGLNCRNNVLVGTEETAGVPYNGEIPNVETSWYWEYPDGGDGDPLFKDWANGDYHLTVNSPLIDQAQNLSQLYSTDFDGVPLPTSGPWDIGALIFVGDPNDFDPPTPDPMTWESVPTANIGSISMTATTATDPSHVKYYFKETSGNPGGNDSGWQASPSYTDPGLLPYTPYCYEVRARDRSPNQNLTAWSTNQCATTPSPVAIDDADSDIPVAGTVGGSYLDTQASDDVYESITEEETGGKPANRYSYLEHKWTINVAGNTSITFNVEAYHTSNTEGDDFVFAYSTTGVDGTYNDMVTVTKIADDDTEQSYGLPDSATGLVHIRVVDTDQTAGNRSLDTIYIDRMYIGSESIPDVDPPTPDPMTWATEPYATGEDSIAMVADTASDPSGVEYYFTCTAGGGHDSGWQDEDPSYEDIGLTPETPYTYTVTARDKSVNYNATAASIAKSATTNPPDTTPPTPDPMTWASVPAAVSSTEIEMTADTASDPSGVEYYFTCTAGGGNDSGWRDETYYKDAGLLPETPYTYTVIARDKSPAQNTTAASTAESATTGASVGETFESYNVVTQAGPPQGYVIGSDSTQADLEFYISNNDGGVSKKNLFRRFTIDPHIDGFNNVEKYWANRADQYPYVGLSTVGRGYDSGEGNTPAPLGVIDITMHPPDSLRLTVVAFIVPTSGNYSISNVAVRRVSNLEDPVTLRVFDPSETQLTSLVAYPDQDWVIDEGTYDLVSLTAGDRIFFGVDNHTNYYWDSTEIIWTITNTY